MERFVACGEAQVLSRNMAKKMSWNWVSKRGFTLDACDHCSDSEFPASFHFEVFSLVTDRVSDKAVEVDGLCTHGLLSARRIR